MSAAPSRWLLLRGLARELRHWEGFAETYRRTLGALEVTCLDLPGAGTEWKRTAPLTVADTVDDLRQRWLQANAGGKQPAGIFGVSLGGMIALDWVARYPDDFGALVLLNTSARGLTPPWQRLRPSILPTLAQAFTTRDPRSREIHLLAATTCLDASGRRELATRWAAVWRDQPMRLANKARQAVAGIRFHPPAATPCPSLVLAARTDALVHYHCSVKLAGRLDAALRVHPGGGHDLSLDDPNWVAGQTRDWVRERFAMHAPTS